MNSPRQQMHLDPRRIPPLERIYLRGRLARESHVFPAATLVLALAVLLSLAWLF